MHMLSACIDSMLDCWIWPMPTALRRECADPIELAPKARSSASTGFCVRASTCRCARACNRHDCCSMRSRQTVEVARWLREIANARVHGTTQQIPAEALIAERLALLPLPRTLPTAAINVGVTVPTPTESIQHPLTVYRQLLEVA